MDFRLLFEELVDPGDLGGLKYCPRQLDINSSYIFCIAAGQLCPAVFGDPCRVDSHSMLLRRASGLRAESDRSDTRICRCDTCCIGG